MQLAETSKRLFPRRERVALDLLDQMETSRSLCTATILRLKSSIRDWGLMQPLVVIVKGQRYLLCIGNHRCEAMRLLGEKEADCLILPEGTTLEEALIRSLHENHVRHDESLPDIMKRVKALMEFYGCKSFAEGAKLAAISESKVSRIRSAMRKLSPEALSIVYDNGIGWGTAYDAAMYAESPEEQVEWLLANVQGEMSRSAMVQKHKEKKAASKRTKRTAAKPRSVPMRIRGCIGGVGLQLTFAPEHNPDSIPEALLTVAKRLKEHCQSGQPLSTFSIS